MPARYVIAVAVLCAFCGGETSSTLFDEWEQVFLSTADMGVSENVAGVIRSSNTEERRSYLSSSCTVLFTGRPALQEMRQFAWSESEVLTNNPSDADIVTAANFATIQAPDVCFDDAEFHEEGFTRETPTP